MEVEDKNLKLAWLAGEKGDLEGDDVAEEDDEDELDDAEDEEEDEEDGDDNPVEGTEY